MGWWVGGFVGLMVGFVGSTSTSTWFCCRFVFGFGFGLVGRSVGDLEDFGFQFFRFGFGSCVEQCKSIIEWPRRRRRRQLVWLEFSFIFVFFFLDKIVQVFGVWLDCNFV